MKLSDLEQELWKKEIEDDDDVRIEFYNGETVSGLCTLFRGSEEGGIYLYSGDESMYYSASSIKSIVKIRKYEKKASGPPRESEEEWR